MSAVRETSNLILGAGIAGLAASYSLRKEKQDALVLEKDTGWGGLCNNFTIQGFRFDRFIHLSFSKDDTVNQLFKDSAHDIYRHIPNPYNLYHGLWIKHPAQNNLFPLPQEEKDKVLAGFKARPAVNPSEITNYEQWLRIQYGDYFAEHFPLAYTPKYWMTEAKNLETRWVGNRLYQPSLEEVLEGCKTRDTPVTYYAQEMRYPKKGGYKAFLKQMAVASDIALNQEVSLIDTKTKTVTTKTGQQYTYDTLISSLPLPEMAKLVRDVPDQVKAAADLLRATCGYQISIGLKTKNIPPYLWWYIYDEDILPARVYSPSLKSPDNAPEGCSSLQMELYCEKNAYSPEELYARSVKKIINLNIIKEEDILFTDIRFEKYANVIFDHHIYKARDTVRGYLESLGIHLIGRFGLWDYLWSDQALLSGMSWRTT